MSKGVAVPYVIALILGIIVVGVIGYWFFVLGGQGGGIASLAQCQARAISYCTQWSLRGYNLDNLPQNAKFTVANAECASYVGVEPFTNLDAGGSTAVLECQELLVQVGGTPSVGGGGGGELEGI